MRRVRSRTPSPPLVQGISATNAKITDTIVSRVLAIAAAGTQEARDEFPEFFE